MQIKMAAPVMHCESEREKKENRQTNVRLSHHQSAERIENFSF